MIGSGSKKPVRATKMGDVEKKKKKKGSSNEHNVHGESENVITTERPIPR